MPSGRRPTSRPGAGPGRGKPRARTEAHRASSSSRAPGAETARGNDVTAPLRRRGYSLTARAIALSVVLLILTISYATSLRIYFSQAHEIAATKAEIAQRQSRIQDLQGELARWGDEAYQRELFGNCAASVTSYPRTAIFRYRSAEENVDFFRTYYGPTLRAFDALPVERRAALNDDMIALVHRYDRNAGAGAGPVAIVADYLETVIIRK